MKTENDICVRILAVDVDVVVIFILPAKRVC